MLEKVLKMVDEMNNMFLNTSISMIEENTLAKDYIWKDPWTNKYQTEYRGNGGTKEVGNKGLFG